MRPIVIATAFAAVFAAPALAEGDAAAGEKAFRQCQSCHVVVNDAGETLAGKKAKTGPNLYGVAGRAAGSVEGFKYSKGMKAANEAGLVWDEASFSAYVQDPTGYLREFLGDDKARGSMSFKLRKEKDAADLYAFLSGL
ncbi:MAG: c-type cytochrome [Mangrovicoccus sp.]|nr:c-type cytochrome [Mangrovicoccus sp.]